MLDPFPFAAPAALSKAIEPLANYLNLRTLPMHMHEVILAVCLYQFTSSVASPTLSTLFFPSVYPKLNKRTKLNWDIHVVSLVQSCLINVIALWVMFQDEERATMDWRERVWGYTPAIGLVQAFACGYFLWDLYVSTIHVDIFGLGMLAHAVSAFVVYSFGFRPFINFYAPTFILYELSSPFLNVHWFCDKLNMTGSKLQLYNGILLLVTFFSCRIVWGLWQSFVVYRDVWRALYEGPLQTSTLANTTILGGDEAIPAWLAGSYVASNIVLNSLNMYWFSKMIATIRKRFPPPLGTLREVPEEKKEPVAVLAGSGEQVLVEGIDVDTDAEVDEDGVVIASGRADGIIAKDVQLARGLYEDGRKTIEIEKKEVRARRRG